MKTMLKVLMAVLYFAMPRIQAAEPPVATSKENFHLYLLVGQSNMAGRGVVEDQDKKMNPKVFMLNKSQKWVPAVDPMHFDKSSAGVGLGKTFGNLISEANPDIVVGLIPCAVGGSPIDSWRPGQFYEPTKSHPWDDAIQRSKVALKDGTLKGILWHQGESDANEKLAASYEGKLHDLIDRFRKELNAPQVPFIAGQIGKFPDQPWGKWQEVVNKAHMDLPQKVKLVGFVNADGLKHKGDKVHFDSESYRELGRRYAKAYFELTAKAQTEK